MTTPEPARSGGPARLTGIALMLTGALSNQLGAATGALAFPWMGPAGVVAVRQWVAAIVLVAVGRPRPRAFTRRQWWPVIALAAVFAAMNLTLYTAIDRVGLGLAVTLEFLGPLSVALAASRRAVDLGCAFVAGAAVLALLRPRPATDYTGLGLGLTAAACWAAYILLNRVIGARLPGVQGSAAAAAVSGLAYLPVGVLVLAHHQPPVRALGCAAAAGVLSSAVPFLVDLIALRTVPTRVFGVFMSVHPVMAALVGWVILGQRLPLVEWLAIAAIVAANTVSALAAARRPDGTPNRPTIRSAPAGRVPFRATTPPPRRSRREGAAASRRLRERLREKADAARRLPVPRKPSTPPSPRRPPGGR